MSLNLRYTVREPLKSELKVILSMMNDYANEEVIIQSYLKANRNKFSKEDEEAFKKSNDEFLKNDVYNKPSLVAVDTPSQQIVGHVVLTLVENPLTSSESRLKPSVPPGTCEAFAPYLHHLDVIRAFEETFERYPGAEKLARLTRLAVSREHRGKGLSKLLLRRSVEWTKRHGYQLVQGSFSSTLSRKAAESVGFRSVRDFDLSSFRNERGEVVLEETGESPVISTMALEVEN